MHTQQLLLAPRSCLHRSLEAGTNSALRLAFTNRAFPADHTRRFSLHLSDAHAGRVQFIFRNDTPQDYAITHVYFDEGEMVVIDLHGRPVTGTATAAADTPGLVCTNKPESRQAEELAVTFDLQDGIGMADLVCALREQRLKISLRAVWRDSETGLIFDSAPVLTLNPPPRRA